MKTALATVIVVTYDPAQVTTVAIANAITDGSGFRADRLAEQR